MRTAAARVVATCAGAAATLLAALAARAADVDLFLGATAAERVRPNVLIVLASSASTSADVTAAPAEPSTRLAAMRRAAVALLDSLGDANVGLMSSGGSVDVAVQSLASNRETFVRAIDGLHADGPAALAETLHEAALYWLGGPVHHGGGGAAEARVSGDDTRYSSPIELACQPNHIVLLGDDEPDGGGVDDGIAALEDAVGASFASLTGGGCGGGACVDALAEFLYRADLSPLPGRQNVVTHVVELEGNSPLLATVAARGGGEHRTAADAAGLAAALTGLGTRILDTPASAVPPAVAVSAFERTRHANDLYFSVFRATTTAHWPGNLKKYRVTADGTIVDANGVPAVDPASGFFAVDTQSFWSEGADGADVEAGGAAQRIPTPRAVFTWLGDPELTAAGNRVAHDNAALTDALLGTGAAGKPSRAAVIDFVNNLLDADGDGVLEPRNALGDSLHSRPVAVRQGADAGVTIYAATNDGYLHAIDAGTGAERWSFVPPEMLARQADLLSDAPAPRKLYGLDGPVRVHVVGDGDAAIEPEDGERVLLYLGMRRGGSVYYALDVTDPAAPRVLWRHDEISLPRLGQTWASPVPARIDIAGAAYADDNTDEHVLVIAGGYDSGQDEPAAGVDDIGNALYIVDALNGNLLWWASDAGASQSFAAANGAMRYSIPADVEVLDLDNDGFADRFYAADTGGQVWRFDVWNGRDAASLVTGGVIASLGAAAADEPGGADARRFYYAPDVALVHGADGSFLHIGLGSGHRAQPNATVNRDRFYALRDHFPFAKRVQESYDLAVPITDGDLVDVSGAPSPPAPGGPGWRYDLAPGEKVLAEARTFDGRAFFTTFTPGTPSERDPCELAPGTSRLYALDVANGAPALEREAEVEDGEMGVENAAFIELGAAAPTAPVFLFPSPDVAECAGDGCTSPQPPPATECAGDACAPPPSDGCVDAQCTPEPLVCVGLTCLPAGFRNRPIRTYWIREGGE